MLVGKSTKNHLKLSTNFTKIAAIFSVFTVAFLATLFSSSILTPVNLTSADTLYFNVSDSGYTASVSSADTILMDITATPGGTTAVSHDTITTITNNPSGYKLYLSMNTSSNFGENRPGNALYQDGNSATGSLISPTSGTVSAPDTLLDNSWGFSTEDGLSFAAVPLRSNPAQVASSSIATSDSGDKKDIYYGVKVNSALPSGTYIGTINYTVATDSAISSIDVAGIYPNTVSIKGGEALTIVTSLYTNYAFSVSDIVVKIGSGDDGLIDSSLCNVTNVSADTGNVTISCITPAKSAGDYKVNISIPDYGKTYVVPITYFSTPEFFTVTDMQSMTPAVCNSATTPSATVLDKSRIDTTGAKTGDDSYIPQTVLRDTRDGNYYVVRKLADGNCWMTENLRLNLTAGETLTAENTDLNTKTTWTPTASTQTEAGEPWGSNGAEGTIGERNDQYAAVEHSYTNRAKTLTDGDGQTQFIGNYYNWYAATAMSGTWEMGENGEENALDSICPKGWSLPSNSGGNSFYNLISTAYGLETGSGKTATHDILLKAPFSYIVDGYYEYKDGEISSVEQNGYIMSSSATAFNKNRMQFLVYRNNGTVNPQHQNPKAFGLTVRCVARNDLFAISTMQEMSVDVCAHTTTPAITAKELYDTDGSHAGDSSYVAQSTLYDIRDGNSYRIRKLADGNCWMTENLRLNLVAGETLTADTTDLNSKISYAPDNTTQTEDGILWAADGDNPTEAEVNTDHSYTNGTEFIGWEFVDAIDGTSSSDKQFIGNYYNWYAATAHSGTYTMDSTADIAEDSICPKGWELPRDQGTKSWDNLIISTYEIVAERGEQQSTTPSIKLQSGPFSISYSGYLNTHGAVVDHSSSGLFWTAAASSHNNARNFFMTNKYVWRGGYSGKTYGASVRCINK